MQIQLKGNKILTEMILNKRHRNLGIIQCEQYTQITDLVQKVNADYFVLIGTFTVCDCQYFAEKFLSSITAEILFKVNKYMNKNNYRFLWTDREENMCLGLMKLSSEDTFLIKSCINDNLASFKIKSVALLFLSPNSFISSSSSFILLFFNSSINFCM